MEIIHALGHLKQRFSRPKRFYFDGVRLVRVDDIGLSGDMCHGRDKLKLCPIGHVADQVV